jgi:uncharacterized iron-regulated membrane protein
MLSVNQAKSEVEGAMPGVKVEACVPYKNGFLARVIFPSTDEANYDPFFMVNAHTGEVQEFSVMTDGDPMEVAEAFEQG